MGRMSGYMLTWSTYGTWLQGDEKGYVNDGKVLGGNAALENSNIDSLVKERVFLTDKQIDLVRGTILQEAAMHGQHVHALSVVSDHVHLVVECIEKLSVEKAVWCYKYATKAVIAESGIDGPVWTKGYDKRFCFNEASLNTRVRYVLEHGAG